MALLTLVTREAILDVELCCGWKEAQCNVETIHLNGGPSRAVLHEGAQFVPCTEAHGYEVGAFHFLVTDTG